MMVPKMTKVQIRDFMDELIKNPSAKIEFIFCNNDTDNWSDCDYESFNFDMLAYRIKASPKEIWVNEYADSRRYVYDDIDSAESNATTHCSRVAVHYREVV